MANKTHPCKCNPVCDAQTARSFAPGHDARMVSRLVSMVASGALSEQEAERELYTAGGRATLAAKLADRIAKIPQRWYRSTETTLFTVDDSIVLHWIAARAQQGQPPWVMFPRAVGAPADLTMIFYTPTAEAVALLKAHEIVYLPVNSPWWTAQRRKTAPDHGIRELREVAVFQDVPEAIAWQAKHGYRPPYSFHATNDPANHATPHSTRTTALTPEINNSDQWH